MANIFELFAKIAKKDITESKGIEYIIVGLGNYGQKYEMTRHNAGFMTIDRLAEKHSVKIQRYRFSSLTGECVISGHKVLLMKPQTYMNHSGIAVYEAADYYKLEPEKVIVLSDDVNLAPGKMRIRKSGSSGGQKGLQSIIENLDSEAFPRIRIGIGKKPDDYEMADWVLSKITDDDMEKMTKIFDAASEAVELLTDGKIDEAMGKYNGFTAE